MIVHERVAEAFAERLVAAAEKLKIGDGLLPETEMGPLVNRGRVGAVHDYTEIGKAEGARLLTGGRPLDEGELAEGAFYAPTIFTDATADMRIAQEEVFGPFVSILPVQDYDEAIARRQLDDLRPLLRHLHRERAHGLPRDARHQRRPGLYQRGHDRRRATSALRRHEAERQRPPRAGRKAVEEFSEIKTVFVSYPTVE